MKENPAILSIVLADSEERHTQLLPLSFTRPISNFRVGIDTIREKWEAALPGRYSVLTAPYLREKFPLDCNDKDSLFISGALLPDARVVEALKELEPGEALYEEEEFLGFRGSLADYEAAAWKPKEFEGEKVDVIRYVFDIFLLNGAAVERDFRRLTAGRRSRPLHESNHVIGSYRLPDGVPAIFLEEGAKAEGAIFNVSEGPIYIGRNAVVMEGSALRGPFALCDNAKVNMCSKIYGSTTIGPYSKIGGEINNAVVFGYSNKAHDGFLGNAVLGEWCNIGAGTNASNLKNDYSKIRIWNYRSRTFMRTDLQFCGLIMGDHSKLGINCMLNTASVIGVGCNIHGSGFPRVFVPSFSEGSPTAGLTDVSLKKFYEIAARVMARRNVELTDIDKDIFVKVYDYASHLKR